MTNYDIGFLHGVASMIPGLFIGLIGVILLGRKNRRLLERIDMNDKTQSQWRD